jgi:5-formyltetrahydrofolate cyclo-ligase
MTVGDPKRDLRRRFKALRDACPAPIRAAWSLQVCAHVAAICAARGILRVGVFGPFGSELDLAPLASPEPRLQLDLPPTSGPEPRLQLWYPRVLSLDPPRLAWGLPPLAPGTWGLREPVSAPHAEPPVQLLLVPGLAFAADGHRLGYGRGFYDAVLAALPPGVPALGAGFELQRCLELPVDPWDRPLSGLVTEAGFTGFATLPAPPKGGQRNKLCISGPVRDRSRPQELSCWVGDVPGPLGALPPTPID